MPMGRTLLGQLAPSEVPCTVRPQRPAVFQTRPSAQQLSTKQLPLGAVVTALAATHTVKTPTAHGHSSRPSACADAQQVLAILGQRAAVAVATVAFTASALFSPAMLPAAVAHEGMQQTAIAVANSPASARFHCQPLITEERLAHYKLNGFHHKINTSSLEAQALFDQGLLLAYNFNHPEALKAFQLGLKYDPNAPMLHWGMAYSLSPYANVVWGPAPADQSYPVVLPNELKLAQEATEAGFAAAQAAQQQSPDDPQLQAELQYITAAHKLWHNVKDSTDKNWFKGLAAYAEALQDISAAHPSDADAPALAAEARMNFSPWVYWSGPWNRRTPVNADTVLNPSLRLINTALERQPNHPLAAHILIHLTEAGTPGSRDYVPEVPGYAVLGERGADILADGPAFPDMGHLTHMSSHTYIRVGRWHDAVVANKLALAADQRDAARCVQPYMPEHNAALLQYAAMMSGELSEALQLAQQQVEFPETFGPNHMSDGRERAARPYLLARFAQWQPIMQLDRAALDYSNDGVMLPFGTDKFSDGVYHYVRSMALASAAAHARDGPSKAFLTQQMQGEVSLLKQAVQQTPQDPITQPGDGIGIYSPGFKRLGQIELLFAQAHADVLNSNWQSAAQQLQKAIATDTSFGYTEPPRQYQPLKACLGWVYLQQGKLNEAEKAYLDELLELPNNPWSLKGLQQVYQKQATAEAATKLTKVESRLAVAWSHADSEAKLTSSCPVFSD
eukprot:GHRR01002288.1.p1 GENE.GHRR01002288.1~~GHRR01002288.1.p1  ORF type:complete len:734 (+),score=249.35 GHRR01002288.1:60-2261(+)